MYQQPQTAGTLRTALDSQNYCVRRYFLPTLHHAEMKFVDIFEMPIKAAARNAQCLCENVSLNGGEAVRG
jgi:hypothetical protein